MVKEKLKLLKEKMKIWNNEVYGIMNLRIEEIVKDVNLFDSIDYERDCGMGIN